MIWYIIIFFLGLQYFFVLFFYHTDVENLNESKKNRKNMFFKTKLSLIFNLIPFYWLIYIIYLFFKIFYDIGEYLFSDYFKHFKNLK